MKFFDTIKEMHYILIEQNKERYVITRDYKDNQFRITFYLRERKMHGILFPVAMVVSKNDLKLIETAYNEMLKDLNTFKELSHYDIMN